LIQLDLALLGPLAFQIILWSMMLFLWPTCPWLSARHMGIKTLL